jgi:hypothetical protein
MEAAARDVMVEVVLFCPFYRDSMWELSPLNAANNVNSLGGGLTRESVYDFGDPAVVTFMDTHVRKIVTHVTDLIVATEKGLPKQHLIAQNVSNGCRKIDNPHPAVSIVRAGG